MVEDILDIWISILAALGIMPIVVRFGMVPWVELSNIKPPLEKTAMTTSSEIDGYDYQLLAADAYLSIAVADPNQPDPIRVRFYENENSVKDETMDRYPEDGLSLDSQDVMSDVYYYQVYYSTQLSPSAINNKVTVGTKLIRSTGYEPSDGISLLLRPRVGDGDNNTRIWCFGLDPTLMKGEYRTKYDKHGWFYIR